MNSSPRSLRSEASWIRLDEHEGQGGYLLAAIILFAFLVSFYLPISSKASNNIFYAGLGLPALVWWLSRIRAAPAVFRVSPWFFSAYGALALWLGMVDAGFIKDSIYLLTLFLTCAMIERAGPGVKGAYGAFSLVSVGLLAFAVAEWIRLFLDSAVMGRIPLWGQGENPVYAALLITSSLVFLWVFHLEQLLARRSRWAFWAGLFALIALCSLCAIIFQARSAMIGFGAFLLAYLMQRRLFVPGLLLGLLAVATLWVAGFGEALLERGLSYRLEIWMDAFRRLSSECGVWLGCGKDDYRFLGQFFHAHSAYVSMLYQAGLIGFVLFTALSTAFFATSWRAGSRWMLVALVGWGGVVTTTSGVIESPRTLWVYFWIPTLMAMLETGRSGLEAYYRARGEVRQNG